MNWQKAELLDHRGLAYLQYYAREQIQPVIEDLLERYQSTSQEQEKNALSKLAIEAIGSVGLTGHPGAIMAELNCAGALSKLLDIVLKNSHLVQIDRLLHGLSATNSQGISGLETVSRFCPDKVKSVVKLCLDRAKSLPPNTLSTHTSLKLFRDTLNDSSGVFSIFRTMFIAEDPDFVKMLDNIKNQKAVNYEQFLSAGTSLREPLQEIINRWPGELDTIADEIFIAHFDHRDNPERLKQIIEHATECLLFIDGAGISGFLHFAEHAANNFGLLLSIFIQHNQTPQPLDLLHALNATNSSNQSGLLAVVNAAPCMFPDLMMLITTSQQVGCGDIEAIRAQIWELLLQRNNENWYGVTGLHMIGISAPNTLMPLLNMVAYGRISALTAQRLSEVLELKNSDGKSAHVVLAESCPESIVMLDRLANITRNQTEMDRKVSTDNLRQKAAISVPQDSKDTAPSTTKSRHIP